MACIRQAAPPAADPELLAFVKALARDLARADAEALGRGRDVVRWLEGACEMKVKGEGRGRVE